MAQLLVSVRSAHEARAAVAGGAAIVDVKEPQRGPLGRADAGVWRAVRESVPAHVPVSVALGELSEWQDDKPIDVHAAALWAGIGFCKIGLARAADDWVERWHSLRRLTRAAAGASGRPEWVGVVYTDWQTAGAPAPDAVIHACLAAGECRGVLFDTWDKSRPGRIGSTCQPWIEQARVGGRFVALAGGLDAVTIPQLAGLDPDVIAVRGAACRGGERLAAIDPERVAQLARVARALTVEIGQCPC